MSIIHKLSDSLAQKIAAGEVVTRPESVVKELIENALDAKAESVTIVLKDAGKTLIQIIDDGMGMTRDDARMSVERHATSKLHAMDDLERLNTFGFRGEALAAISSVSQFELRTRTRYDELGTVVEVEGGVMRKCESFACDEGTSIAVRNLFFNIPARRKFMKSEATEFKHIVDTVTRAALSHIDARFIFISDGDIIFDLPAFVPLPERIEQIFGGRLRNSLLAVESVSPQMHIHGFVSAPSFVKRVRTEQFLFINGRPVQSRGISYAVQNAYEHLVEKGAFPSTFIFVDIDPSRIDVNVHPQKLEVKFEDERSVIDEVRHALQAALTKATSQLATEGALAPEMTLPDTVNAGKSDAHMRFPEFSNASGARVPTSSLPSTPSDAPPLNTLERLFGSKPQDLFRGNDVPTMPNYATERRDTTPPSSMPAITRQPQERTGLAAEVLRDKPVLWQLHNKYIFSQIKSGMMIVDQHVAHERILFERVLRAMEENMPFSQQLLFPQHIDLLPREMAMIKELLPELERIGFHIRFFGGMSIVIDAIPGDVRSGREDVILREVLDAYEEFGETKILEGRDALAAGFACRAAIKSGDKLGQEEMHVLIEQLFQTKMPYVCPHGRPIVIKLAIDELDRRFGRSPVEKMSVGMDVGQTIN